MTPKNFCDLEVYKEAEEFADRVWELVNKWDFFAKDTVGKQLVKAADSISANISEGYGRFHFKENKKFCYYARGSLTESRNWIRRAYKRNLLTTEEIAYCKEFFQSFPKRLNAYIKSIGKYK